MSSVITALTSGGGLAMAGDTSGQLQLLTNNGTAAVTIDTAQKVGIGTTSPSAKLHVTQVGNPIAQFTRSDSGVGLIIAGDSDGPYFRPETNTAIRFNNSANTAEYMRVASDGSVLIGTTTGQGHNLVVGGTSGTARVNPATDNVGYIGDSGYRWQAIYAVNGTIQTSDGREKNTIVDSDLGLNFISTLRPVSYKWNVGENIVTYDEDGKEIVTPRAGVRNHYGFIAQEVKSAIPQNVDFGGFVQEPDDGAMSLRYHEFIAPMVKAIQELNAKVDAQALEIQALKGVA